ncbi:MAG: HAMP domain-containing protein [Alphaproteobacteria bacterium]|nr:HAMP domain-containing protein [Alphaproteobacteria bacterium]
MIKRFWPTSILGRAMAVLAIGLLLSHLAALALYSGNREEALTTLGGRQTAERIVGLATAMSDAPPSQREQLARSMSRHGFFVSWSTEPYVAREHARGFSAIIAGELGRLAGPSMDVRVQPSNEGPQGMLGNAPWGGPGRGPMHEFSHQRSFMISLKLADGSWLNAVIKGEPPDTLWRGRFLMGFAATTLITLLLAAWAVSRAVRPLRLFAGAAERLGTDMAAPPLDESGPAEVKKAAHAFNRMQERLRRFVDDRTRMLAAISHDLRTPLTRMRLRAEFVDDEETRAKMLADLDEMEAMIGATLAFARDSAKAEDRRPIDLAQLLSGLATDMQETGRKATFLGPEAAPFTGAPIALKRAFSNLVDNAIAYGGGADISLTAHSDRYEISIADEGPGIPEDLQERVFAPFFRIEGSRSRETGGVGLGLSVARDILRGHGGDISLANRQEGGLRVTVSLPRIS